MGFREGLDYSVNKEVKDNNGRISILDVEVQGKPYLIINLYADNDEAGQLVTLAKLESLLESFDIKEECKIILGGNFNIIFDKHLDADGGSPCLKVGTIQKLMVLCQNMTSVTSFRSAIPNCIDFLRDKNSAYTASHSLYFHIQ